MKKFLCLLMFLAVTLSCVSAGADFAGATVVNKTEKRNITIHAAGNNEVPEGISPTTGRSLDELADEAQEGFLGMAVTGEYYPVMVQHHGYAGGVGIGAPWYGSYADVYYELPKSNTGHTRMCMIFNDFHPKYVGGSRSTRVGYIWIRQEWNAPYFFAGMQEDSWPGRYDTNVNHAIAALKLPSSYSDSVPAEQKVLFNGLDGAGKPWIAGKYRVANLPSGCNLIWDLPYEVTEVLGKGRTFANHTWKFTDSLPETGDTAETVYVLYKKDKAATGDPSNPDAVYYFNSMFQYDEDENVYYRYMIADLKNPENGAVPFKEQYPENVSIDGVTLKCTRVPGEEITFANVIVQFVEDKWPAGECPYPILTGTGNAEYFMGGKHLKGVWNRNTYDDRTVFYGEDGEEISLQPGRTFIVIMDHNVSVREIRYE